MIKINSRQIELFDHLDGCDVDLKVSKVEQTTHPFKILHIKQIIRFKQILLIYSKDTGTRLKEGSDIFHTQKLVKKHDKSLKTIQFFNNSQGIYTYIQYYTRYKNNQHAYFI